VMRAAKPERLDRTKVSEVRGGLRWMLEKIESGELTAGPGLVARLEGAVEALNVLLGESSE
jgi:hypothetical protein